MSIVIHIRSIVNAISYNILKFLTENKIDKTLD